jgi:hypothetical protein
MDLFARSHLKDLLDGRSGWRASLLMPAHRGGSEQDPIRFRKQLMVAADKLVAAGMRPADAKELLKPAQELLEDPTFWRNQSDGLAVFLATDFVRVFRLPLALPDTVVVGQMFHIKPLLPLVIGDGRFFILALSQNGVRLLQGTHHAVQVVDLRGVPENMAAALIRHDRDEQLSFHTRPAGGIGSWGAIFHGHGVGIDDEKDDLLLYFEQVDRGLHAVLKDEHAPLVLAAVESLQPIYRQANTYGNLVAGGISGNPDRLSDKELHDRAWPLVQPLFKRPQVKAANQYHQLAGSGRTGHRLEEVVLAADRGELETLFVPIEKELWGRFDPALRTVEPHAEPAAGDEDLANVAASAALRHGRTVYAVPSAEIPSVGPFAGIYCLPLDKHAN